MFTETRKLSLLEQILEVRDEAVLIQFEKIINEANSKKNVAKRSAHDFVGILTKKDASLMTMAIKEGCEQTL